MEKAKLSEKFEETIQKASDVKDKAKDDISKKYNKEKQRVNNIKLETKLTHVEKKIEKDIESAGRNVDSIVEDADTAIDLLVEELDYELNISDYPTEYLLFKSENRLNAIILHAEYEIQVVNNNLIKDLENDFEKLYGLTGSKSNEFIEKIRNSTEDISEKFETRKEELHSKFKDEQN